MLAGTGRLTARAVLIASIFLLASGLLPASDVAAVGPSQSDGESVDIDGPECTFWLDFDDDGEGDAEINTVSDSYARQQTPVVGSCEFKLNTSVESTLVLETELDNWRSVVEIVEEPGLPDRKVLQPGRVEIPGLVGGMKITVEHRGVTPRSVKNRTLRDDYHHDVQVPRPFRLLDITVTTPSGTYDRLERTANSASSAFIETHKRVTDRIIEDAGPNPDTVAALTRELLYEGYPQIAGRLLDVKVVTAEDGSVNWWMWATIGLFLVIVGATIGVGAFLWLNSRRIAGTPAPASPTARGNM